MKKKLLFIIAALTMACSLVACGGNSSHSKEAKATFAVEGDGSLIPKSVTIDGVEYKKNSTLGEFIENGWTIFEFDGTDITDETTFYLEKPDCDIIVSTFSEESKTAVQDKRVSNISVTNHLGNNKTNYEASNGIKIGLSNASIDTVYESVSDKIHVTISDDVRVGEKKYGSTIYKDSDGCVSYGYFVEEDDETIYSISVIWHK